MSQRIIDMATRGDYHGVATELRRTGHLDGPALEKGALVAFRIPGDAQVSVGRVLYVQGAYLWTEDTSWIDHTGEYYADALSKGATARGWSSEYEGTVCTVLGAGVKVALLPDGFVLPKESVRP